MRSLFSSKNLCTLAAPAIKIQRKDSGQSIISKQSDQDLHKFTELQNKKVNVAAKIMGGAPLIITE